MRCFSLTKINIINELRLPKVFLLVTLLLLISAKGWGQTAIASNSGPICAGADVSLFETGVGAVSWVWSSNGSAIFSSNTAQNPIASGAVDGEIFTVVITDINSHTASATTTVTVNTLPVAAGTITGTAAVCEGQTGVGYSVEIGRAHV